MATGKREQKLGTHCVVSNSNSQPCTNDVDSVNRSHSIPFFPNSVLTVIDNGCYLTGCRQAAWKGLPAQSRGGLLDQRAGRRSLISGQTAINMNKIVGFVATQRIKEYSNLSQINIPTLTHKQDKGKPTKASTELIDRPDSSIGFS